MVVIWDSREILFWSYCVVCVSTCNVPYFAIFLNASHPCSHTPVLSMFFFITLTIISTAPASSWSQTVIPEKSHLFVCVLCAFCNVRPFSMFPSAPHPFSHTPALSMCSFITLTIISMALASLAFSWISSVIPEKSHLFICVVCVCNVHPFVMFLSTPHPCSHISALSIWYLNAPSIILMAPALSALSWMAAVNHEKSHLFVLCWYLYICLWCTIHCDVAECSTPLFAYNSVAWVCLDCP